MAKPKKETAEHRRAFDLYLAMGTERSTAAVGREVGKTKKSIDEWSSAFGWVRRVDEAEKRISDKAAAKLESKLVNHQAAQIEITDRILGLFLARLRRAVDARGEPVKGGYVPSAMDAKIWADVKTEILSKGSSAGKLDLDAFEGMTNEQIDRIIVERITRVSGKGNFKA